jgi:hypothetical protein
MIREHAVFDVEPKPRMATDVSIVELQHGRVLPVCGEQVQDLWPFRPQANLAPLPTVAQAPFK